MLKHDTTEMNPEIFHFVNPYEVNPGNSRVQQYLTNHTLSSKISPNSVKIDTGDPSSCEFQETPFRKVKVEMEEFSDLGDLIPSLRGKSVMDELDLQTMEPEGIIDFTNRSYESANLGDFVDAQDSCKRENNQVYIDNHHINLEDIIEDELYVLKQELSSGCANSELNEYNNNHTIEGNNLTDETTSYIRKRGNYHSDRLYSNVSSPSDSSITSQYSPKEFSDSTTCCSGNQMQFRQNLAGFNLGVKLFVGDTLNTPDILESVVSLEDERFNFLNCLNEKKLQTINEADLKFQLPLSPESVTKDSITNIQPTPEVSTKQSRKRKKYDDDDEDYLPPTTIRTRKKTIKIVHTDSESDEEYIPTRDIKNPKGRLRRISSVSSDSSKCSGGVSKYRELRDKNNEASRKSRLKRKVKEQEIGVEAQELETRNVKLKAEVEELQRMVENLRSNLFQIMMKK